MKKKNQLFLFMLLLFFASCNKEQSTQTTVSGVVKARNGEAIIPFAEVYLMRETITRSVAQTILDTTIADAQGRYKFDFDYGEAPNSGGFRLEAKAPLYYTFQAKGGTPGDPRNYLAVGKTQTQNVELWPYAWLKMRLINQNGAAGIDINGLFGENNAFSVWGINDAIAIGRVLGNSENVIGFFVYNQDRSLREVFTDSAYCPAHDTTFIEIIY